MAKPSWLSITPTSGSGNGQIQYSATSHTGRVARPSSPYESIVENSKTADCTVSVTQNPKAEFVQIQSTASPAKTGGTLKITGTGNAATLTFSYKDSPAPTLELSPVTTYTVNSASATSGTAISGDPGASAQYTFEVTLEVPENMTLESKTCTLVVQGSASSITSQCVITQSAGDPYLWVGKADQTEISITIPQAGTAQSVQVLSNDAWTVS